MKSTNDLNTLIILLVVILGGCGAVAGVTRFAEWREARAIAADHRALRIADVVESKFDGTERVRRFLKRESIDFSEVDGQLRITAGDVRPAVAWMVAAIYDAQAAVEFEQRVEKACSGGVPAGTAAVAANGEVELLLAQAVDEEQRTRLTERQEALLAAVEVHQENERATQAAAALEDQQFEMAMGIWRTAYPSGVFNWATVEQRTDYVSFEFSVKNAFNARLQYRAWFTFEPSTVVPDNCGEEFLYVRDD